MGCSVAPGLSVNSVAELVRHRGDLEKQQNRCKVIPLKDDSLTGAAAGSSLPSEILS